MKKDRPFTKFKHKKRKIRNIRSSLIWLSIIALISLNIYFISSFNAQRSTLTDIKEEEENITRYLKQIVDDSKEIRKEMGLPELLYELDEREDPLLKDPELLDSEQNGDTNGTLYSNLQEVIQIYRNDLISTSFSRTIQTLDLDSLEAKYGLDFQQKNSSLIVRYKNHIIATISALYNEELVLDGIQYSSSILGNSKKIPLTNIYAIIDRLHKKLQDNLIRAKSLSQDITELFTSAQISELLTSKQARWKYIPSDTSYTWNIYNLINNIALEVTLNAYNLTIYTSRTTIYPDEISDNQVLKEVHTQIQETNYRTQEEQHTLANKQILLSSILDNNFQTKLSLEQITISSDIREDDDYTYFDIQKDDSHTKIGAFAIQKNNGAFWTMDKDDIPISQSNILSIVPPDDKEILQAQSMLLVGSHNQLADTIIIVHINTQQQVSLISIPRDLYYKGRKINWYFKRFSPGNFKNLIAEITGVPLSQYVYVDMYAFISIINILGGITVELKDDLIDPTFKIKENGVFTSLRYHKGEHILNGIEALRIARSRYSTNDFDRASRQQAILKGVQKKFNDLDVVSSFVTIIKIINKIYPYITTNITNIEMARIAQTYRKANISKKVVLNTQNILYTHYSFLYENDIPPSDSSLYDAETLGQWILLPKNNDWNLLKFYIESFIME